MAEQPRKIKKYRKPLNLNIGMLIFGAIFIYVIIHDLKTLREAQKPC